MTELTLASFPFFVRDHPANGVGVEGKIFCLCGKQAGHLESLPSEFMAMAQFDPSFRHSITAPLNH